MAASGCRRRSRSTRRSCVAENAQLSELKLFLCDDVGVVAVRDNTALTLLQLHVDGLWSTSDNTTGAVYVSGTCP